ncbi:hypothetical protein B0T22DRAFT_456635 [Podospora appendiculata]|uniref:Uncharacterized protein n=1 Tax=Podospora appendiculata TaxID=314037 RepID=A0AAE1CB70_9PEZI|nr:hypothetical protein B0T22DRAFT_456635 [Podospora appendiculata]
MVIVYSLMGMTCCGRDMQLGTFMRCMRPAVSRELWLLLHWAEDPSDGHRACGWPDCRALIPACCEWLNEKEESRWYCVTCRANSQATLHGLIQEQTMFPFLPRGHQALFPAR